MFDNFILTTGEKIRKIRRLNKLTQKDIAGDYVTGNYISLIESDKKTPKIYTANAIANNINKLTGLNITGEWLIESIKLQVDSLLLRKIESEMDENKIKEIESILKNHINIIEETICIKACKVLLYHFKINKNAYKAIRYIDIGIKKCTQINEFDTEAFFRVERATLKINTPAIDEALFDLEYAKEITNDKQLIARIEYNKALIFRKKGLLIECLNTIDELVINYKLPQNKAYDAEILKANCFSQLKEYEKALNIYNEQLNIAIKEDNTINICLMYYNMADIYAEIGDIYKAVELMRLRFEIKHDNNIIKHLIFMAKLTCDRSYIHEAYEKLKLYPMDKSIFVNKTIEFCITNNELEGILLILDDMLTDDVKINAPLDIINYLVEMNVEKEVISKYITKLKQ